MTSKNLSEDEKKIVKECLVAISEGPFLYDWDFQTLMGVTFAETQQVAEVYPDNDELESQDLDLKSFEEISWLTINNSFVYLLYYQDWAQALWKRYISVTEEEVAKTFKKWKGELNNPRIMNIE
ncbi:MAG: hypothetical protein V7776_09405 [Halopseudomonas aestusnigri]